MLRTKRILMPALAAGLAVTWLCAVPPSNGYAQSEPPDLSDRTPNVPDQKLDAVAAAIKQVASVREDYEERIVAAAPSDREQIAEEAKTALAKAVTDQGLSLPEYTSIVKIAQNDPEVRDKILHRLAPSDK